MAQLIGIARLGRDAELRHTAGGEAVASLSLAFSYGRKGEDGKQPTQWVDGALWGKRAEAIAPHLTKGQLVYVVLDEAHIETFKSRDGGEGYKLTGRVSVIEFAGSKPDGQRPASTRAAAPAAAPKPPATSFDDMDSDIPFALSLNEYAIAGAKARRLALAKF